MNVQFKNPLVVGYKGEIGSFLLSGLLKIMPKALNVWCFDINESEREREYRIRLADYIFLCVPIQDTMPWLLRNKHLLKDKTIVEQTSLKTPLYKTKELSSLRLVPMHLLFRPSVTPDSADRRCALFNDVTNLNFVETIKEMTGCSRIVFYRTAEDHDKDMAVQQGLVHRVLLTLRNQLKDSHTTYVSQKIWELIERIKDGDKTLYSIIQSNTELPKVLKRFKEDLNNFNIKNE